MCCIVVVFLPVRKMILVFSGQERWETRTQEDGVSVWISDKKEGKKKSGN